MVSLSTTKFNDLVISEWFKKFWHLRLSLDVQLLHIKVKNKVYIESEDSNILNKKNKFIYLKRFRSIQPPKTRQQDLVISDPKNFLSTPNFISKELKNLKTIIKKKLSIQPWNTFRPIFLPLNLFLPRTIQEKKNLKKEFLSSFNILIFFLYSNKSPIPNYSPELNSLSFFFVASYYSIISRIAIIHNEMQQHRRRAKNSSKKKDFWTN